MGMGESMNDNPYASPRAYGERRRIDWDRVYEVWFFTGIYVSVLAWGASVGMHLCGEHKVGETFFWVAFGGCCSAMASAALARENVNA